MYGIKETKELLKFIIEVAKAIDVSLADGELSFTDLTNLVGAMMVAGTAFDNINMIPMEIADLDKAEAQELYEYCKNELNLQSDKIEEIVEMALTIGLKFYELFLLIKPKAPTPTKAAIA